MNTRTFLSLIIFILSLVLKDTYCGEIPTTKTDYRIVSHYKYSKGNYYDVLRYEFEITPTRNVAKFDYYVYSDNGTYVLLMDGKEYEQWVNYYYDKWLDDPNRDLIKYTEYLNSDNKQFMCRTATAACQMLNVRYTENELFIVIIKNPTYEDNTYILSDHFNKQNDRSAARIISDPLSNKSVTNIPNRTSDKLSSTSVDSSNSLIHTKSGNSQISATAPVNGINGKDTTGKDKDDNNNWIWYVIGGGILLLVLLASLIYAFMHRNNKDEIKEIRDIDSLEPTNYSSSNNGSENEAAVVTYNPHHAVKRVAYNYKTDDVSFERDNIVEITKRYNDGWAKALNPKDGKECIVPLIILEGDLSEDLSNIPYEEKSDKNFLATPESLYENEYISKKDYEEMKRNDEWMKKVKLMKSTKPESTYNFAGDNDQIKFISHPIEESTIDNGIVDQNQSKVITNRKSMVATVVNSNTELLSADHVLEVCEEGDYDYEPEEGVIIKEDI